MMQLDLGLPPLVTVHCFLWTCAFTAAAFDPDEAHALMEQHYTEKHAALIRSIVSG